MTMHPFLVVAAALATVACAPSPTTSPGATSSARPTGTTQPTTTAGATLASPSPSLAGVVREIDAARFTETGGCGDTFLWAATQDDATAITVEWQGAASTAWDEDGFDETADLPDSRIRVALITGRLLSTTYCNDIVMPEAGSDSEVPATSGNVSLVVRPDAGGMRPTGHADLTLSEVEFEVTLGTEPEVWRLDTLELDDVLVGWFAG